MNSNPLLKDITDNDPEGIKEVRIQLKEKAYMLGLNLQSVMSQVRYGFFGFELNLLTAQTNFNRTEEQFKIGQVSSVAYRQAQLNLLHAQTAILTAKYEAKVVELQLLQLTGRLQDGLLKFN